MRNGFGSDEARSLDESRVKCASSARACVSPRRDAALFGFGFSGHVAGGLRKAAVCFAAARWVLVLT
jgi:hypothetical protein